MRTLGVVLVIANALFMLFDVAALCLVRDAGRKYLFLSLLCAYLAGGAAVLLVVSNP